jgi:hypothetical protein
LVSYSSLEDFLLAERLDTQEGKKGMDVIGFVDKRRSGEAEFAFSMQVRYGFKKTSFGIADTASKNLKRTKWSVESISKMQASVSKRMDAS